MLVIKFFKRTSYARAKILHLWTRPLFLYMMATLLYCKVNEYSSITPFVPLFTTHKTQNDHTPKSEPSATWRYPIWYMWYRSYLHRDLFIEISLSGPAWAWMPKWPWHMPKCRCYGITTSPWKELNYDAC